jgi:dockerin type I repeat protein
MKRIPQFSLGLLLAIAAAVSAAPVEVGSGVNEAKIYIEWADGFSAEFLIRFGQTELETTTGLALLDLIEAETELLTERTDYDWGTTIDGITYQEHSSAGYGGGDLWWHYWTDDTGSRDNWISPWTGASDRIVCQGDADAWIYGHGEVPKPQWETPFLSGYGQYVEDANDFATAWIDYQPQGMMNDWLSGDPYADPNAALGRPTVDTTGDDWSIPLASAAPVVPVYPAFRHFEIVFLGEGGSLTLAFGHPVRDDEHNPYGIDFIVFGNAPQMLGAAETWANGNPADVTAGDSGDSEPGIVSVSQDGTTWYSFTNDPNFMTDNANFIKLPADAEDGPFCDGFAPTLGRVYDPCYADNSIGATNQWWAEPTNPTLPVDPELSYATLGHQSVARVAQTYGDSAGGTGYDLARLDLPVDPDTQLKWFQYVRIDDAPGGGAPEIDAVADVSSPGDYKHPAPLGDVDDNFRVDIADAVMIADYWDSEITGPDDPAAVADLNGDGIVDDADLAMVLDNLGITGWGPS